MGDVPGEGTGAPVHAIVSFWVQLVEGIPWVWVILFWLLSRTVAALVGSVAPLRGRRYELGQSDVDAFIALLMTSDALLAAPCRLSLDRCA